MLDTRTWGDGVGKRRPHEVAALSYEIATVVCAVDGAIVRFAGMPADVAWDQHRGIERPLEQAVVDRSAQATDAEVDEFLRWVAREESGLPPTVRRGVAYGADHAATPTLDSEEIEALLTRLAALGDSCTCATNNHIIECPNYVDGDEETYDDE